MYNHTILPLRELEYEFSQPQYAVSIRLIVQALLVDPEQLPDGPIVDNVFVH